VIGAYTRVSQRARAAQSGSWCAASKGLGEREVPGARGRRRQRSTRLAKRRSGRLRPSFATSTRSSCRSVATRHEQPLRSPAASAYGLVLASIIETGIPWPACASARTPIVWPTQCLEAGVPCMRPPHAGTRRLCAPAGPPQTNKLPGNLPLVMPTVRRSDHGHPHGSCVAVPVESRNLSEVGTVGRSSATALLFTGIVTGDPDASATMVVLPLGTNPYTRSLRSG
jgi:hypothetical protein